MNQSDKQQRVDTGFAPEALDPAITCAIDRLTKSLVDFERVRGPMETTLDQLRTKLETSLASGAMDLPSLGTSAERLMKLLEQYSRTALSLTKVVDEAARLRSFIAGGADSRPDLSSLSDSQLRQIIASIPKDA